MKLAIASVRFRRFFFALTILLTSASCQSDPCCVRADRASSSGVPCSLARSSGCCETVTAVLLHVFGAEKSAGMVFVVYEIDPQSHAGSTVGFTHRGSTCLLPCAFEVTAVNRVSIGF